MNKDRWRQVPVLVPTKLRSSRPPCTYIKPFGRNVEVDQEDDNEHDEYAVAII